MAAATYWLTLLLLIPAIIGTLGLSGMLGPARGMLDQVLGYVPSLGSAALILALGWFVARVLQRLAVHGLIAAGLDRLGDRIFEAADRTIAVSLGPSVRLVVSEHTTVRKAFWMTARRYLGRS